MSDIIKIKRSDVTAAPSSLGAGELAYSETSGHLFYGRISDGAPVVIGGKALKDKLDGLTSADIANFTAAVESVIGAAALGDLSNVNITGAANGQVLTFENGEFVLKAPSDGVTEFIALNDSPASYSGSNSSFVRVNAAGTGLEFVSGIDGGTY